MPVYLEAPVNRFAKLLAVLALSLSSTAALSFDKDWFPKGPDARLTPGSYCQGQQPTDRTGRPLTCERNVDTDDKWAVIRDYNQRLGYNINQSNRGQFKIDHLVPLCFGGSNEHNNLWPQHQSIYVITDKLEDMGCQKLRSGRVGQAKLIKMLVEVKNDLSKADAMMSFLNSL